MKIRDLLAEAMLALTAHRLRTALTMLGLIIGIASVIALVAIGQGTQLAISESIAEMGSNLYIITSGTSKSSGVRGAAGSRPSLTLADAYALEREIPNLSAVVPIVAGSAQVVYGPNNWNTRVWGVTPNYLAVGNWQIAEGSGFDKRDVHALARVAIIGHTVAREVFGNTNPVGKIMRIGSSPYLVRGVLLPKGQGVTGQDQDDVVLVPVTTAQRLLFGTQVIDGVSFIMAQAVSLEVMPKTQKEMERLLRQRHRIRNGEEDDFSVRDLTAIANTAQNAAKLLSYLLGAIASISLLVGGIGIMNIMLVSVTERTREIGIRLAIGAKEKDILFQFLCEAILVSFFGALIGLLLGFCAAWGASAWGGMTVVINIWSVVFSILVAAGIGVFFGFYPAKVAARQNPIDALRYE